MKRLLSCLNAFTLLCDILVLYAIGFVSRELFYVPDVWRVNQLPKDVPGSHAGKQTPDQVRSRLFFFFLSNSVQFSSSI